jgi:hypothetical protein
MDEGLAPLQCNEGCVEGAVKGGRSPAKRTLEGPLNADTLQGLGLVADFRSQPPSPSGGEDFPALGGGVRGGGSAGVWQGRPLLRRSAWSRRLNRAEMDGDSRLSRLGQGPLVNRWGVSGAWLLIVTL